MQKSSLQVASVGSSGEGANRLTTFLMSIFIFLTSMVVMIMVAMMIIMAGVVMIWGGFVALAMIVGREKSESK